MSNVILSAHNVVKTFPKHWLSFGRNRNDVNALGGVSLAIAPGENLGIVGESGSGKTTLARLLLNLDNPTAGHIAFRGKPLSDTPNHEFRGAVQAVFQDPASSCNPRMRVSEIVREPLSALGIAGNHDERIDELLRQVGLDPFMRNRYPHELSGGQRQRVALARALAPRPTLLIADEPFSALDVLTRDDIVELLRGLVAGHGLTLVVISHDLGVVAQLCDTVAVMKDGKIMEHGTVREVFSSPRNSFTAQLLSAVPRLFT